MKEQIFRALEPFGFTSIGLVSLTEPITFKFYEAWLDQDLNAGMKYLEDHRDLKKNLNTFLPNAKSVICVTLDYFKHPKAKKLSSMKIASYAKGEDYHYFFKSKLNEAANALQKLYPGFDFKTATDAQPILERDFSYQAGLGWIGKNTMLIDQHQGSYFLIGEIVTTLNLADEKNLSINKIKDNENLNQNNDAESLYSSAYNPDRCGKCTKCIEACPTQALTPQKLNAAKCISYWTIESKTIPPISLAQSFDSWFFGCDICQDVCPWNIKVHSALAIEQKNQTDRLSVLDEIIDILKSSNKSLEKKFFGTPLARARGFGIKRNALIVALNMNAKELISELNPLDLKNEELNKFKHQILKKLDGPI